MRRTSLLLTCACAAASLAHADRPGQIQSTSATTRDGITVRCVTTVEPSLSKSEFLLLGGGIQGDKDRVHRFMVDDATKTYFGYDIAVASADTPNRYRVSIEPLSLDKSRIRPVSGDLPVKPASLPQYPAPQVVEAGDTIVLDLLVSPDGRQKVIDYIQVAREGSPPPSTNTDTPKDFTVDDGPVTFDYQGTIAFLINSKPATDTMGLTTKRGSTFWVYLPGRGRFILSLVPRENFQKTGVIRDHVISFQADGNQYELRLLRPIVGSGGAWNLYVLNDPLYRPQNPAANIISAGVDRIENLLPQR